MLDPKIKSMLEGMLEGNIIEMLMTFAFPDKDFE